jgi:hypothetical protein
MSDRDYLAFGPRACLEGSVCLTLRSGKSPPHPPNFLEVGTAHRLTLSWQARLADDIDSNWDGGLTRPGLRR